MMRASRCFCKALDVTEGTVLCKDFSNARLITLNRGNALNAINIEMINNLRRYIIESPHDNAKAVCILKGDARSFSTGGDIIEQSGENMKEVMGRWSYLQGQTDNYIISCATNTYVSLMAGYVMGGAAGLAINPRYRVATETTQFAMPECSLGFFTNGGATWFLPRTAVTGLGLYLALSGSRLKGADMVHAGLATHYVPTASLAELEKQLCKISNPFDTPSCIQSFHAKEVPVFSMEAQMPLLESVFALRSDTTVEGIFDGLKSNGSEFAMKTLSTLQKHCPTSLKVMVELQKRSVKKTGYAEAVAEEVYLSQRMVEGNNFREGVRAVLVEKTKDPKWDPATLAEVSDAMVSNIITGPKKGYYIFDPINPPVLHA